MVQYCAVPKCKSSAKTPGISFHYFPKDKFLKKLWITQLGRDQNKNVSPTMRVCSLHFSPEDIVISKNGKYKILRSGAVPQKFNVTSTTKNQQLQCSSVENFAGVKVKVEQDTDNEINNSQEKNAISTNIIYLKSAESREASKNTPLQIQENVSQVIDSFVHKTVSYGNMVVAQKVTSEWHSSEDTETASEIGRDESVIESVEENEDASVQKVVGSFAHKAVSYCDSVTYQRARRESLSSEATESASEGGSDESEDESVQEIEDDSIRKTNSLLTKRISELEAENEELKKENKKLKAEIKTKDDCLTYLSELMKFSSFKSENEEA